MEAQSTLETQQETPHRTQPPSRHHRTVVIGGGTAGITVAARLGRALDDADVAVIEPSLDHYYQPLWTLVGAGVFPKERSRRPEASVMPREATWIREAATAVDPDEQVVTLESGQHVGYDYLVVAPGLQIDWDGVEGLEEHLGKDGICSIYAYEQAERTWEMMRAFEGGAALFTSPATPIKCGGAPQKIMYLADDLWRKTGVREGSTIQFVTAGSQIFGVPGFRETLQEVVRRKGIQPRFGHDLIELRPDEKEAVFRVTEGNGAREEVLAYDLIHVTPPMSAPDFIKAGPLAYQEGPMEGWLEVDKYTLQHLRYPNVFGLGDVAGLPTAKTGAAVRKQAPTVVHNLRQVMEQGELRAPKLYDGYSSCPLVTGYGKMVLAEFDYDNNPAPSIPFIDTTKEHYSMYLLKKYGLPFLYWNLMLKGWA